MATLMNVNNQAMPMGDNTGQTGDGQTGPKRHFKHIGELADESKAKVVIMYRTVPGEADNCLVVGTKFLPDMYHNALMKAVESDGGQEADELADFFARDAEPGGTIYLSRMSETISLAEGEFAHAIDLPDADFTPAPGRIPSLGAVSYI